MRPRKVVLYVDADEKTLSVRRFVVENNGYRVIPCLSAFEALGCVESKLRKPDVMVVKIRPMDLNANDLAARTKQLSPETKVLVLADSEECGGYPAADVVLAKSECKASEVLHQIRMLGVKKRGPKPETIERMKMEAGLCRTGTD